MSAYGTALPAVITVSGLSEQELPGTEFLVLEVLGFVSGEVVYLLEAIK